MKNYVVTMKREDGREIQMIIEAESAAAAMDEGISILNYDGDNALAVKANEVAETVK